MTSKEEIKEDLDHILSEVAKTQNIQNYDLNPDTTSNYGDGFVAQFFTGELKDRNTGDNIAVAIKKAPILEFNYKGLFNNELLFYNTIFPVLDTLQKETNVKHLFHNVPNFFCGSILEPKKEYIAMENLKPLGYGMYDKTKFFDQDHLELIFRTYGKLHALSTVLRIQNYETYRNITKEIVDVRSSLVELVTKQIVGAVSAAVKALDSDEHKVIFNELKDFGENTGTTFEKSFEYNGKHRCVIHGDCWSNNMLFKYSDSGKLSDMKLLDFQLCRDTTPIHDLSYFFYSGASKKDFDNIEFYLKIYYKSFVDFAKELGADPDELWSFEVLVSEWKENALFGAIFAIYLWQLKLTAKEEFNNILKDFKDIPQEQARKLWSEFVQKIFESSRYKENTTSILIHAYEYGVLNKDKIVKK